MTIGSSPLQYFGASIAELVMLDEKILTAEEWHGHRMCGLFYNYRGSSPLQKYNRLSTETDKIDDDLHFDLRKLLAS
jgi:hypothetical protein